MSDVERIVILVLVVAYIGSMIFGYMERRKQHIDEMRRLREMTQKLDKLEAALKGNQ